jgi:hypothetical protein
VIVKPVGASAPAVSATSASACGVAPTTIPGPGRPVWPPRQARFPGGAARADFDDAFADPTKSAHRARSLGRCRLVREQGTRFVLDFERTWYWLGGATGDRPTETSSVGRMQTVF